MKIFIDTAEVAEIREAQGWGILDGVTTNPSLVTKSGRTHEEVLLYMGRFMQYYREHGKYLERSYGFVERVGIDTLRKILVEDSLGICAHLDAEIQKAVDAYRDPWQEAVRPAYHAQFSAAELAYTLEVAENNG